MPKYTVIINRTTTIEKRAEVTISATDEDVAQEKVEQRIEEATEKGKLETAFTWTTETGEDEFDYEVSEE